MQAVRPPAPPPLSPPHPFTFGKLRGGSTSGGMQSGKYGCSSGLVYRRILPWISSVSRSRYSRKEYCRPSVEGVCEG